MRDDTYEKAVEPATETPERQLPREQLPVQLPRAFRRRCARIGHIYGRSVLGVYVCRECGHRLGDTR